MHVDLPVGSTLNHDRREHGRINIVDNMPSDYKGIACGVKLAGTDLTI